METETRMWEELPSFKPTERYSLELTENEMLNGLLEVEKLVNEYTFIIWSRPTATEKINKARATYYPEEDRLSLNRGTAKLIRKYIHLTSKVEGLPEHLLTAYKNLTDKIINISDD
jgi:hypothetical protein